MPIYEYICNKCGHQLEAMQKMSDAPLIKCPECHSDSLNKLISAAGFQLKGTGWYATDFRNKDKSKPSSDTKTTQSDKSSSSSSTTDGTKS
jgi:putative FmdB family regulatory protein